MDFEIPRCNLDLKAPRISGPLFENRFIESYVRTNCLRNQKLFSLEGLETFWKFWKSFGHWREKNVKAKMKCNYVTCVYNENGSK